VRIKPTAQDEATLAEVEEREATGEIDREMNRKRNEEIRRERRMIAAAHSEAAAIKASL
jgi:large subunit ribosomal protein MRP49